MQRSAGGTTLIEEKNGHYLDKYGCSFGQVSRTKLDEVEKDMKSVNNRLGWLLVILITQLVGMLGYMATHWKPI
jgi:hypothetical protein